jgi:hypothetical protein
MPINADKPHLWKADVEESIDFYNDWFIRFAPETYRKQRAITAKEVTHAFELTDYLRSIAPDTLAKHPQVLPILRMACAPPIARDRLMGLARTSKSLIQSMEGTPETPPRIPPRMPKRDLQENLKRISETIQELADRDLLAWLESNAEPEWEEIERASTVVADRLCGATSDPIIRNAQEQRQLASLKAWLDARGYNQLPPGEIDNLQEMAPGTYAFRLNVVVGATSQKVNIPVDCAIKPHGAGDSALPILVEAKSAGDATNTNKRRKEEAQKYHQLVLTHGRDVQFILLLCGYFEPGYLGYEASEGIDWVWEHRLNDLNVLVSGQTGPERKDRAQEEAASYVPWGFEKEAIRSKKQICVDGQKTQEQRNRMGQFSTPFLLARQIVEETLFLKEHSSHQTFIEPAMGSGVFFSALENAATNGMIADAIGVEIDPAYGAIARELWGSRPWHVVLDDFINFSAHEENACRFGLLCTNPPYVRHHHLSPELKQELQARIARELGLKVSGLSGLYVYFMLLAHSILEDGAAAAWLVPSEFLYVNYGKPLRDYLLNHVTLTRIHQFDPADVQFDDALVSSCVVVYKKSPPEGHEPLRYTFGGGFADPREETMIPRDAGVLGGKWALRNCTLDKASDEWALRVSDLFDVKRGIATGANDFFIVDGDQAEALRLPSAFLKPILPSPRMLLDTTIDADEEGCPLLADAKRFFLLDCRLPYEVVADRHPELCAYLRQGEDKGISASYLCSRRKPWYLQERREPAPFLVTYMTRRDTEAHPFRFFLNRSRALATNVFILLYPKPPLRRLLSNEPERMVDLLDILNGLERKMVIAGGRTYGGGLHKLEPGELASLPLPPEIQWLLDLVEPNLLPV